MEISERIKKIDETLAKLQEQSTVMAAQYARLQGARAALVEVAQDKPEEVEEDAD